ncbi:hypothetical protein D3C87_1806620 [compost metagenome]
MTVQILGFLITIPKVRVEALATMGFRISGKISRPTSGSVPLAVLPDLKSTAGNSINIFIIRPPGAA